MIPVFFAPTSAELASVLVHIRDQARKPLVVMCRTSALQTMVGHQLAHLSAYETDTDVPVRLTTFESWLRDVWIVRGDGRQLIDATGRRIYLQRILEGYAEPLSPILTTPAGRSMLEGVCKYHHLGTSTSLPPTHLVHTIEEIATRYDEEITAEGLIDIGGAIAHVRTIADEIHQDIVLLGFSDLTHAQQSLLEEVTRHHTLSILGSGAPDSLTRATVIAMAEGLGIPAVSAHDIPGMKSHQQPTISEVARQMYRSKRAVIEPNESAISFHLASGEAAQIATIIAELHRLRATDGINRIAVVLPSLRRHIPHLVRALERHQIPYQFDTEIALPATDLGIAFLALTSLIAGADDAGTVARFTESTFSGWSPTDAIRFDRVLRLQDPDDCIDRASFIDENLSQFLTREKTTTSMRAEQILELARASRFASTLEVWQELIDLMLSVGVERGSYTSFQHTVMLATYRTICTTLFELSKIKADRIHATTLKRALEGSIVQINPLFGSRDVILSTPERIDGLTFDALIVAGTDSNASTATTNLSGTQQVMHLLGMDRHRGKSDQAIEDSLSMCNRFFEVSVVQTPQTHLSIIYQQFDEKGDRLQPSGFLEEVVAQFQQRNEGFTETLKQLVTRSDELVWDSREVHDALCLSTENGAQHVVPVLGRGEHPITPPKPDEAIRISSIEAYAQCPYEWFINNRVCGFEFDRVFDMRDVGTTVHAVLKETFIRWKDAGNHPVTEENVDELQQIADEVLAEHESKRMRPLEETNPGEYLRIQQFLRNAIATEPWLRRRLDHSMNPLEFELSLPKEDPIRLEGLALSGTIDRVDVSEVGYIVTDYKTTGSGAEKPIIKQRRIQAPLYLLALEQWVNRKDPNAPQELTAKQPAGFMYRAYKHQKNALAVMDRSVVTWTDNDKTPNPANHQANHEKYAVIMDDIHALIADAINGIVRGAIPPRPKEKDREHSCNWCPVVRCPMREEGYR